MKLIKEQVSWKDYVTDSIQLTALITTVAVILYCVDAFLNYSK